MVAMDCVLVGKVTSLVEACYSLLVIAFSISVSSLTACACINTLGNTEYAKEIALIA
jgi:hypothetical protein